MSGSWLNLVRSPYGRLFKKPDAAAPKVAFKPPTPPPVSPLDQQRIVDDDKEDDENLSDVDVDISDLVELNIPSDQEFERVPTPPVIHCFRNTAEKLRFYKNIRLEEVRFLTARHFNLGVRRFDFLSATGLPTLVDCISQYAKPVIFDATKSILLSIVLGKALPNSTITIQASDEMHSTPSLLEIVKERATSSSIRFDPLCDFDLVVASKYTHIVAEFTKMTSSDIDAILNAYNSSTSTGVVCAVTLKKITNECKQKFPNLVFTTQTNCYTSPPSERFSRKRRTTFVCISHKQGEVVTHPPIQPTNSNQPRKRLQPCSDFIKSFSPLHPDFSFEQIATELSLRNLDESLRENTAIDEEEQKENADTQVTEEHPLVCAEPEPSSSTQQNAPTASEEAIVHHVESEEPETATCVSVQDDTPSSSIVEVLQPTIDVVSTADDRPPTAVVQDDSAASSSSIIILDDEDSTLRGKVAEMKKRVASKTKMFRQYRSIMPVDSSPEFGGSCPTMTDRCVEIIAELMLEWINDNEGPYSFLDVRSKSTMGLLLSTLFKDVSFGHVVYSRMYDTAIYDSHRMFKWPLKKVVSSLDRLTDAHFTGYTMAFASASCLGNKDHRQLECIIDSFDHSADSQVLWMQMTKPQAAYATQTFTNLKFKLVRSKFPNQSNDPLYEILK